MLPLEQNNLTDQNEWHKLKNVLIALKYLSRKEAIAEYENLSEKLKETYAGKEAKRYIDTRNIKILDNAAEFLTQSKLPEAWLYIERL